MTETLTEKDLLAMAEAVLDGTVVMPGGYAPRAAALLARQAFEEIVDLELESCVPGLGNASMRSRLIVLSFELGGDFATRVEEAWAGLSQACHHHSYQLQPTEGEVRDLIALIKGLDRPSDARFVLPTSR